GGCLHHAGDATDLKGVDEAAIVMVISGILPTWEERATMGTRLTAIRGRGQPNPEELYPPHTHTHTHTHTTHSTDFNAPGLSLLPSRHFVCSLRDEELCSG